MSRLAATFALMLAASHGACDAASLEVDVHDGAGKPVADVAVYATSGAGAAEARPGRLAEIQQIDREFVPYVTVVQAGTTVTFPNRDPILHHVYSFSPAKSFEIKLYKGGSPSEVLFDKPGVVTLGCNIHDWMIGYVLVVPTPHFGKTDANGVARLHDLPSGSYEIRAWHPQQRAVLEAVAVTLEAGAAKSLLLSLDTVPRKAKYKPPLDRIKY
jgi:plastocyanin